MMQNSDLKVLGEKVRTERKLAGLTLVAADNIPIYTGNDRELRVCLHELKELRELFALFHVIPSFLFRGSARVAFCSAALHHT